MQMSSLRTMPLLLVLGSTPFRPAIAQTEAPGNTSTPAQTDGPPPGQGGPRHGGMEHRLEMMQRSLALTTEQMGQVKAILEASHSRMEALRTNSSLSGEERRTQMMSLHQEESTKLRALLTSEQAVKYDAMEAHRKEQRPGNGDGPPPPPGGQDPGTR